MKWRIRHSIVLLLAVASLLGACAPGACQAQDRNAKFRLAQTLEQSGEYERAAGLYRELLQQDPANPVLFDGLQRTLVQLKRYDEAIKLVRERRDASPSDLNLCLMLAGIYQRAGMERQAEQEWEAALTLNPTNPQHYRLVASSMIEHRLLEKAAGVYRRGRVVSGDQFLFTLELSQLLAVMMDFEGATEELVTWLAKNPTQLAFVQGRLASFAGKPDGRQAAIRVVQESLREREDVRLTELLAWLYLEGRDFEKAYALTKAIDGSTNAHGVSLLLFAERAFKEQAYDIAARAYLDAITAPLATSRIPAARYGHANTLRELAALNDTLHVPQGGTRHGNAAVGFRYEGVLEAYESLARDFPASEFAVKARFQIGMIQLRTLFDLDGASKSFRTVEENVGGIPALRHEVRLRKGEVSLARGDTADARREFLAVASAPDALPDHQDEAQLRAAELDFFEGHLAEAARRLDSITVNLKADYANDALRLQTFLQENSATDSGALALYGRAELCARQHLAGEAITLLQQVVRDNPDAALTDDALLRIGTLLDESGRHEEAVATYSEILTRFKETSIVLDRAQFNLAETYEFGLRRIPEAMAAYEKLLVDHPTSVFAGTARRRIRVLRGDLP